jgi:hypothetical protein
MTIFTKLKTKAEKMSRDIVLGLLRHSLTFIGGVLVARGIADESQVADLIGGLTTLIGAVWSIMAKKK